MQQDIRAERRAVCDKYVAFRPNVGKTVNKERTTSKSVAGKFSCLLSKAANHNHNIPLFQNILDSLYGSRLAYSKIFKKAFVDSKPNFCSSANIHMLVKHLDDNCSGSLPSLGDDPELAALQLPRFQEKIYCLAEQIAGAVTNKGCIWIKVDLKIEKDPFTQNQQLIGSVNPIIDAKLEKQMDMVQDKIANTYKEPVDKYLVDYRRSETPLQILYTIDKTKACDTAVADIKDFGGRTPHGTGDPHCDGVLGHCSRPSWELRHKDRPFLHGLTGWCRAPREGRQDVEVAEQDADIERHRSDSVVPLLLSWSTWLLQRRIWWLLGIGLCERQAVGSEGVFLGWAASFFPLPSL
ncbi:hypothetical protein BDK51DRAFT_30385 [Blyttiomyces helicus]|uniref:Uncharacterized protein n=1 Tax=Blyttiomyces helicus TaxID=388810 RepID=A0A4P9WP65_9FUNG|nr:hypothetical protein BDK51DRAFT_30385 [Blyttiomyces helicus]|eukprot:RKO93518.1 hypothetical protein BDK51DRAFT_30385 [Blyttiomyces helicus]